LGLLERIDEARGPGSGLAVRDEQRFGIDPWISNYLIPASLQFGGQSYQLGLNQTLAGQRAAEIVQTLPGYMGALRACPPAFAAQLVRALVISQARFTFRNPPWHPRTPRRTFGSGALGVLEKPWKNATTGELLSRMEWHAGLAGNAFVALRGGRLRVLRPDWTAIIYGSELEPDNPGHALDGQLLGYLYVNGGFNNQWGYEAQFLLPDEVAHWSPIPDPENAGIGMSWLTPAIRDLQGDTAFADFKLRYIENGATPNLVVKGIPATTKEKFDELVAMMEEKHAGIANAFRTLYLTAGADASVIGSNLSEIDFKSITASGETRLSVLSRVPASLLGISEGLSGSSLNAGNFAAARRSFADTWVYPSLQDVSAALAPLVKVPADAELWFDVLDIPLLREDAKDAAEITQIQATTISILVRDGFTAESAKAAVKGGDMSLLVHSGLVSVQLQTPGGPADAPAAEQAARNLVEMVQKVYLGVDVVIDAKEAREILNKAGAGLAIPGPDLTPAPKALEAAP
jgi:phage portal protein BeeE